MSGRDREQRDRSSRTQPSSAANRFNEYFLPKEGIDREVITADICRYLGRDALVRPGIYENPQTGQREEGYMIKAYRNLTSAMIMDLKLDSERWDQERRMTASRGQATNVEYRASQVHQTRQYLGPSGDSQPTPAIYQNASPGVGQGVYDSGLQFQSTPSYAQPATGYPSPGYGQDAYYVPGADFRSVDRSTSGLAPSQAQGTVPRTGTQYPSTAPSYQPADPRYYSSQPLPQVSAPPQYPTSSAQYASAPTQYATSNPYPTQNPQEPFYGRGPYEASPDIYDNRGYEEVTYTQSQMTPSSTATASSSTARRDHERERDRHHRSRR